MSRATRIALIGMGKIAHDQHLPSIAGDARFELVATVSRHGEAVAGLPSFASVEALGDADVAIDAVAICTPPQVRREIALTAIAHGWHAFLEKPPAATLAEAMLLRDRAAARGTTLFASWHSRHAPAVASARAWLSGKRIDRATIVWAEDVRQWHPGQDWIFEPGGFGVFDPAINALSIATRILPQPFHVEAAAIDIPENRGAAIAATVEFRDAGGAPIGARFDFLQEGRQSWDIVVDTEVGRLVLAQGGAVLSIDGAESTPAPADLAGEYPALYARFAGLIAAGASDVDLAPLELVADIHLKARMRTVAPFEW